MISKYNGGSTPIEGIDEGTHRRLTRLSQPKHPVPIKDASLTRILPDVGASARLDSDGNWVSNRDSVDTRLIEDVNGGTGWANNNDVVAPNDIGNIATGTAYTDTDSDGMPDDWEELSRNHGWPEIGVHGWYAGAHRSHRRQTMRTTRVAARATKAHDRQEQRVP